MTAVRCRLTGTELVEVPMWIRLNYKKTLHSKLYKVLLEKQTTIMKLSERQLNNVLMATSNRITNTFFIC